VHALKDLGAGPGNGLSARGATDCDDREDLRDDFGSNHKDLGLNAKSASSRPFWRLSRGGEYGFVLEVGRPTSDF